MEIPKKMTAVAYCRLCAELQRVEMLFNLNIDMRKCEEITSILSFLNATYVDFSVNNDLDLTVCMDCYEFMIKIHEFLSKVKNAQQKLSTLARPGHPERSSFTKEVSNLHGNASAMGIKPELENCVTDMSEVEIKVENFPYCDISENPFVNIDNNYFEPISPVELVKTDTYDAENEENITEKLSTTLKNSKISFDTGSFTVGNGKTRQIIKQISFQKQPKILLNRVDFKSTNDKSRNISAIKRSNYKLSLEIPELIVTKNEPKTELFVEENQMKNSPNVNFTEAGCHNDVQDSVDSPEISLKLAEGDESIGKYRCEICNTAFDSNIKRYRHKKYVHKFVFPPRRKKNAPVTIEDLTCKTCSKVYKRLATLNIHIRRHHSLNKVNVVCDKCGKAFDDKIKFKKHEVLWHAEKSFICRICGKSFVDKWKLKDHVLTHSDEKTFSCPHCEARFSNNPILKDHIRKKHTHTRRSYPCKYCSKTFQSASGLNYHSRSHTGDYIACTVCARNFKDWGACDKHMKHAHNTTAYKNKKTPQGKLPIDPTTGEVIKLNPSDPELEEWKKQILKAPRLKSGPKPKLNAK